MATAGRIRTVLAPLGDMLAVVVNLSEVTAAASGGAYTSSHNGKLGAGQRLMFQPPRRMDVSEPAVRRVLRTSQGVST